MTEASTGARATYHLVYPAEKAGYKSRLITMARDLNKAMPDHILDLVDEIFKDMNITIADGKVAVLGLGFKANNGSLRSTPAESLIEGLQRRGALVVAYDPFARSDEVKHILPKLERVNEIEEALYGARCAIIATDHSVFRRLSVSYMKEIMAKPCAIVDARHIINPKEAESQGIIFRGLGKPRVQEKSNPEIQ